MSIEFDPETKTYSCRISIGHKEPIPFEKMRGALKRAIGGTLGRWQQQKIAQDWKELTDLLFWFEEGTR